MYSHQIVRLIIALLDFNNIHNRLLHKITTHWFGPILNFLFEVTITHVHARIELMKVKLFSLVSRNSS